MNLIEHYVLKIINREEIYSSSLDTTYIVYTLEVNSYGVKSIITKSIIKGEEEIKEGTMFLA